VSRRGRARDRVWRPPGAPPPTREQVATAPAERPSWPRSRAPSLGQSAAVAARLGQGLPPATVETPAEPVDLDPTGPPVCPSCGRQHETPGELRRPRWPGRCGPARPTPRRSCATAAPARRAGAGTVAGAAGRDALGRPAGGA